MAVLNLDLPDRKRLVDAIRKEGFERVTIVAAISGGGMPTEVWANAKWGGIYGKMGDEDVKRYTFEVDDSGDTVKVLTWYEGWGP